MKGNQDGSPVRYFSASSLLLFLLLFAFSPEQFGSDAAKLPDDEVSALKVTLNKLGKKDWNFSIDPCSETKGGWNTPVDSLKQNNVTCNCPYANGTVCHAVSIKLKRQNLTGVLPGEMSKLTYLTELDLSPNYLSGTIPTSWASLPLTMLVLSGNHINGKIPKEIGNIKGYPYYSKSLERTILVNPEDFLTCQLQSRGVEANKLDGPLPLELGNLAKMEILYLNSNQFTGELPSTLARLTEMTRLSIRGSNFTGKMPDFVGSLTKLQYLMLMGTTMQGPIPSSISALGNLTILRIADLSGPGSSFPPLQSMQKLQKLTLRNCNLSGEIPLYIWSMKNLTELDLSFNCLTGKIPQFRPSIDVRFLRDNKLTGEVPGWVSDSKKNVDLSENSFTGIATLSTCQSENQNLVSSFSSMEDLVPACLRKGYPCPCLANYSSLFINCEGDEKIVNGTKYEADRSVFGESACYVSPEGNWALTSTARTSPMAMTYYGLCLQSGSYNVKLHFSEIVFANDHTFSSLGELIFDVFIQDEPVLENFNIAEEAGGAGKEIIKSFYASVTKNTLEIKFYWSGKGTISIPNRGFYGPLVSAISVTPKLEGLEVQTGYFSLKQIKVATRNLHPKNKIGEGGFGPIYKGCLSDGTTIAVKQLSSKSKQGNREFLNEIDMISALQHPNLVKLFGCCIEDQQLILIYEYMENNSLARALFGPTEYRLKLDWPNRCKICIGIARGLAYLHEECTLKIVHRDIKATNILLDKDLNAKISDFGLAMLDEVDKTHIITRVAGTIGYMAPEYATRGYLTHKADVFSFGVVALEIVSGQSNAHSMPDEDFAFLLDWACVLQEKGRLLELVDPSLGTDFSEEEALRMLNIALLCTSPSPSRPTMSSIVDMLEGRSPAIRAPTLSTTINKASLYIAYSFNDPYKYRTTGSSSGFHGSRCGPWVDSSDSIAHKEQEPDGISQSYIAEESTRLYHTM